MTDSQSDPLAGWGDLKTTLFHLGSSDDFDNWVMQLVFWSEARLGAMEDHSAFVAEVRWDRGYFPEYQAPVWDYKREYLDTIKLNGKPPPEWHALWWVGEWMRRRDA